MTKSDPKTAPKNAQVPKKESCREATMGVPGYVPCGKPATFIVQNRNEVLPMCAACADHNVRNRSARYMLKGEKLELSPPIPPITGTALPIADVEADESGPNEQQLATITANVSRALKLQELFIPEAEAALAKLQLEYKNIIEVVLPNAMVDAKMGGYTYADRNDGKWLTELVEDFKASVTKENLPKFINYLTERKEDDLVKRKITIKFGRDQVKLAMKFIADLKKRKVDLAPKIEEEVNWQTLNAYVRERRQEAIENQRDPEKELPESVSIFKLRFVRFVKQELKKGIIHGQ